MHCLANPTVNDYSATSITSTSMTLTWSPPDPVPNRYEIGTTCKLHCNNTIYLGDSEVTLSPPFNKGGMLPFSQCQFHLTGLYGNENVSFSQYSAISLPTGKTILMFVCIIIIFNSSFFTSQ